MTIEALREEAQKLGYHLLNVYRGLTNDDVIRIACIASEIPPERFKEKTRESRVVFARHLASYYWATQCGYNEITIARLTGNDRTTVYYAKRVLSDDIKFFKIWQQKAIRNFNDAIQKAEQLKYEAA
jgi:chromosomal replication initiation ATPase DnaA